MKNINTNQMHDARGHHAGDGALPMIVGTITPHANKNDWFTTDGFDAKHLLKLVMCKILLKEIEMVQIL